MAKKSQPFNNPFGNVKLETSKPASSAAPAPKAPPPQSKKSRTSDDEDAALFLESVGAVAKVPVKATRVGPPEPPSAGSLRIPNEEAESLARLAELVSGDGPFDLSDSEESIEGCVQGFDQRVMRQLRRGEFPPKATVDLHGLTREEARPKLEAFVNEARIAGHRCVLVVTGRGLHSEHSIPVLKQSVQAWLTRGRPAKQVLGFCSARPQDGGTGAVYVLLRR